MQPVGWRNSDNSSTARSAALTLTIVGLMLGPLQAQSPSIQFEKLSVEHGLSQSSVTCILQDSKGYMWFGTLNGLNQYDGYSFTDYRHDPNDSSSISNDQITAILEDENRTLWVGTQNGLNRFDPRTRSFTRFKHEARDPNSLSHNLVSSIYEDRTGMLWIGTAGGLNRFDAKSQAFSRYKWNPNSPVGLSSNTITTILEDIRGELWAGTNGGGLNKFDAGKTRVTHYFRQDNNRGMSYSSDVLNALDELVKRTPPLAAILNVSDSRNLTKDLLIDRLTDVLVVSSGEITDERYDYGWLERDGRLVWEMLADSTRHAGGAAKNRLQMSIVTLLPGKYELHFQTDESHAFGGWNRLPPLRPNFWGIQLIPIDAEEKGFLQNSLGKTVRPNTISSNRIQKIFEDSEGRIWIATNGGGLNLFDPQEERFQVFRLFHDDVVKADRQMRKTTHPSSVASNFIRDIRQDQTGLLWLATAHGLSSFDPERQLFSNVRNDPTDPGSLSADDLASIYVDKTGIIWIGAILGGINKINPNKNHFRRFISNPFVENTLTNRIVYAFLEDQSGLIWIGTWGGLSLFDPQAEEFVPFEGERSRLARMQTSVMILHQDQADNIWIGTNGGGLFEVDGKSGAVTHHTSEAGNRTALGSNIVQAIHEDEAGVLWFATYNGLCKLDLTTSERRRKGFQCYVPERNNPQSLSHAGVRTIFQDASGIMWIGTNGGGLNRFDAKTESFTHYKSEPGNPTSLSHNVVTSIYEGAYPKLWVTTYGGGLNRFDRRTKAFKRYTEKDGLPNNVLYGILPDELGNLWISTNNGLTKFDPEREKFINYDLDNGLQSNEFNTGAFLKLRNGEMMFGGINGFNKFHPKDIRDNPHAPEIVITNFKKFNETVWFDKSISDLEKVDLSYQDSFISFEFAALDYTNPKKNQYAYMLEGFDKEWVECGNRRFASYTNLDPGEYTFKVRGSNNDGVWNQEGASIRVEVIPPWWQTWWFKTGLAGSLISFLFLGYRIRIQGMQARQRKLENTVSERTKELQSQKELAEKAKTTIERQAKELREMDRIKSRFFANISHEFRTPLTLILGPLEQMLANGYDEKSKRVFGTMRRNANRLLRLINQLLDLSQLESGKMQLQPSLFDVTRFSRSVVSSFASLAESKSIRLRFTADGGFTGYFDRDKLEKILFNLLSNAIKFTSAGGQISVHVSVMNKSLQITVKDTGIGIPPERLRFIFDRFYKANGNGANNHEGSGIGLALTKELIELHGGRVEVHSEIGKGTQFAVALPWRDPGIAHERDGEFDDIAVSTVDRFVEPLVENVQPEAGPARSNTATKRNAPIVLIVEDHPDVQRYIQEQLSSHYRLVTALNGKEGVRKAMDEIPDLVISDVMMPEMDGYELCRVLKTDEKTCHIPIILLTAKAALDNKLEGLGVGADDYLTKPFDLKELQVRARNLIDQRRKLREQFAKRFILEPNDIAVANLDEVFLQKVCETIQKNLDVAEFGAEALSQALSLSPRQLQRKLGALTNHTPIQFIRIIRLRRARQLLEKGQGNVAQVAYEVGFNNLSYFSKCFRQEFGVLPSEVA